SIVGPSSVEHPSAAEMYQVLRAQPLLYEAIASSSSHWGEYVFVRGIPIAWVSTLVSTNYFTTLGVRPYLGRDFVAMDAAPGAQPVGIASYAFWQKWMRDSAAAAATSVTVGDKSYTIVGVMPPGVGAPAGVFLAMPRAMEESGISADRVSALVRLRTQVPPARLQAQLQAFEGNVVRRYKPLPG